MKRLGVSAILCLPVLVPSVARAGGLFLPGAGAVSTARAGAGIASADDGEALALNPAGLAKAKGTTITVAASIISYSLDFQRRGNYFDIDGSDQAYEGQPFNKATNHSKAGLGIGSYQPVPVIAIISDLGGAIPGLHVAAGLYAPNAYPFRDMAKGYEFNGDPSQAPPASRYDVMQQDGAVILPSIAAAYRITDKLDIGARFSAGIASIKSTTMLWGLPNNTTEDTRKDSLFHVEATDHFIPTFGAGVTFRPTPSIELAATYDYKIAVVASGNATAINGPGVELVPGKPLVIGPGTDDRCSAGGTFETQKACVDFGLPQKASIGGRYKFLDNDGVERGDVELNVGWENWGARCDGPKAFNEGCTSPSTYFVRVNAAGYTDVNGDGQVTADEAGIELADNYIEHNFKDTYNFRLGGSYVIPLADKDNSVVVRAGVGYDTKAANDRWYRTDLDGAGRLMTTVGGAYKTKKLEINVGFGGIFEGEYENPGLCVPPPISSENLNPGCSATGGELTGTDRNGPDPINPAVTTQTEHPVNQGTFHSHYIVGMLGVTTWF